MERCPPLTNTVSGPASADLHERGGLPIGATGNERPAFLERKLAPVARLHADNPRGQAAAGTRTDEDTKERRGLPGRQVLGGDRHGRRAHAAAAAEHESLARADRVSRNDRT